MSSKIKDVKDLGWDKITLTAKKFDGAIQSYTSSTTNTPVAVLFNYHEAFIVADEQGLFGVDDLFEGIMKEKSYDIEFTGEIDGAHVIAWEENGEFGFDEEKLTELGLNDFETKESLKNRLFHLSQLDAMVDLPLS